MWEGLLAFTAIAQAAFLLGYEFVIFRTYVYHINKKEYLLEKILMSASFMIMTALVVLAVNFRVFYDGLSRDIANLTALISFILTDVGIILHWRKRREKIKILEETKLSLQEKGGIDRQAVASQDLTDIVIVVVDDDNDSRELLLTSFELEGFTQLKGFAGGQSALEWLKDNRTNIIICDLVMSGMDGLSLIEKIRADERINCKPKSTIVILTAHNIDEIISDFADTYNVKWIFQKGRDDGVKIARHMKFNKGVCKSAS